MNTRRAVFYTLLEILIALVVLGLSLIALYAMRQNALSRPARFGNDIGSLSCAYVVRRREHQGNRVIVSSVPAAAGGRGPLCGTRFDACRHALRAADLRDLDRRYLSTSR
jgi:hypothetical protein